MSHDNKTKQWTVSVRDLLALMAGIGLALALARFTMHILRDSDDPSLSAYLLYLFSFFLLGGSIGAFFERLRVGTKRSVAKGFVNGGFVLLLLRVAKAVLGIPGPF